LAFGHPKSCAFHGSCAPGTSSMRCSRLFVHSLPAARGQSPSLTFGRTKRCAFHGNCAPGTSSMRCGRLFVHSLPGAREPCPLSRTTSASLAVGVCYIAAGAGERATVRSGGSAQVQCWRGLAACGQKAARDVNRRQVDDTRTVEIQVIHR
jgi:hypothetical protein